MQLAKLLNTSTFRLALIYLALFITSVGALLGYIYWNTAGYLARQTDEAVQDEIFELAEEYRQGGLDLLVHTVIQRSRDPRQSLYLVLNPAGSVLAGNLNSPPNVPEGPDGWLEFDYDRKTMEGSEIHPARAKAFILPENYYLLVGRDVLERRAIENLITGAIAWAIALTVAFGLLGGFILSRNMLARVDDINRSSRDIMGGDLSQRLPVQGTGDELDQLAENLNKMLEQIESLMTGMRQVTDNIAHDLRSPLNRLRTRLEFTLRHDPTKEEYREALEKTMSEADELLGTFNALLMIARAEAGAVREAMDWVDLSAVVRDAAELYEPVADEEGMVVNVEVANDLKIYGSRELLSQVVANLLDNAVKHARSIAYGMAGEGGEACAGEISLSARRVLGGVQVVIADSGPGIPEKERDHVLKRFVRLEASRNTPGSGLGLSLAAAVARLHGGRLKLQDNKPGLRAVIDLPMSAR